MVNGICRGCKRTLDEIANWAEYSDEQRQKIIEKNEHDTRN